MGCKLFITPFQAQAGWSQHDFGHLSVFKSVPLNHAMHWFTMCFMKASHTLLTLGSQLCCHVKAIKTSNMKLPLRFAEIMEGSNINHKTELIANVRECFQESQH